MRRRNKFLAMLAVLGAAGLLTAELAHSTDDDPGAPTMPLTAGAVEAEAGHLDRQASPVAEPDTPRSAMMQDIHQLLAAEQATVEALQVQSESMQDRQQALAIQKQVEQTKQETELRILGLQAEYARREGRQQQAAELEQAVRDTINPPLRPAAGPTRDPADGMQR